MAGAKWLDGKINIAKTTLNTIAGIRFVFPQIKYQEWEYEGIFVPECGNN